MSLLAFQGQTLRKHVNAMLNAWESVKGKYIPSIIRAMKAWGVELSREDADRLMKALIILHDSGKGAELYQDYLEGKARLSGFRHELVSAYYALKILPQIFDEKTAFVGSLVVMLHHEPILMGQVANLDRDSLSAEVALDRLKNFDGVVPELNEFLENSFREHLGVEITVLSASPDEVVRAVVELSVRARHLPDAGRLRLIVGALLIPLVLCDYKGAEEREGETPKFAEVLEAEWLGVV
ncbi:CRISPR-associated endonuclease Cas3'' [Thermococcus thioreducens]|uniref:CRISPR-associated nuclease, Cas3 family n=1 Tax=Thermococcus thioreducens TaxID=277988 RepID=A0A0Q2RFE4_9EURY|nr:CRISPR-associated endonuclease Cas3'' [Thermococcus thioreducens]ASJ12047.1 CRISPR-associated protein [Thermococcus thioreducens]KQH82734.1 CRISPR-associated protein [Thermococcus thioreducens]SEW09398.1 CRISPR-associated nuclease, Cas3 family [Thermococcus thioreducens]